MARRSGFGAAMCGAIRVPHTVLLWYFATQRPQLTVEWLHQGSLVQRLFAKFYGALQLNLAAAACVALTCYNALCNCKRRWSGRWSFSFPNPSPNFHNDSLSSLAPRSLLVAGISASVFLSVCVCVCAAAFATSTRGGRISALRSLVMCICAPLRCFAIYWLLRAVELLCQGAIHVCVCVSVCFSEMSRQRDVKKRAIQGKRWRY